MTHMDKVNLSEKLSLITERWSPKVVGEVNDFHVKLVKLEGEFVVVPFGTEHCPRADEEVHVLLLEPKTTVNIGTAGGERTRDATWI